MQRSPKVTDCWPRGKRDEARMTDELLPLRFLYLFGRSFRSRVLILGCAIPLDDRPSQHQVETDCASPQELLPGAHTTVLAAGSLFCYPASPWDDVKVHPSLKGRLCWTL